jgi:hypothetical protein
MLRVLAPRARSEQPLGRVGNEQVPLGIDFPLDHRPALVLGHRVPKLGRGLNPLAQRGAGRGFHEIVACSHHRLPS